MAVLSLVPHQQLSRKWRQSALHAHSDLLPFSIKELVAHLLKEQGHPYRDSLFLEQIAVWEAVWEAESMLEYFVGMVNFPGFIADLHRLFYRYSSGEVSMDMFTEREQSELILLFTLYREKLAALGVLDQAQQLEEAVKYWPQSSLNQEVDQIDLYYLGELTKLEQRLIETVCRGKKVNHCQFSASEAAVSAVAARKPVEEIEHIAESIVELLRQGVEPERIAVISPDLESYLAVIIPIFEEYKVPWQRPAVALADTPMGKAVQALLRLMQPVWMKSDLEQLTAPGWGLPFALDQQEHRALKLAPPNLRSKQQWQAYLQEYSGWQQVFQILESLKTGAGSYPVRHYLQRLEQVFVHFPLHKWPALDHQQWAVLHQSYHGLQQIGADLALIKQPVNLAQFIQMWTSAAQGYALPQPRSFLQKIMVSSLAQAVGMGYHTLFLVGITESNFPRPPKRDWLSRQTLPSRDLELYQHLLRSTENLQLSFSEEDHTARMNIASQVFPEQFVHIDSQAVLPAPKSICLGSGMLTDSEILNHIAAKYKHQSLSVSRLNIYASCPFRFLCSELYSLEEEEMLSDEITPLEEGNLIHETLRIYWEKKGQIPIDEILAEQFKAANQPLTRRILDMVTAFNRKDVELVESTGYYPTHLEKRFSDLIITTDFGSIKLNGIVDRIDVNADGGFVIYDYKTGANPTVRDVIKGENLQLQVYLLASGELVAGQAHGIAFYSIRTGSRTGLWRDSTHRKLGLTRRNSGITPDDEWDQLVEEFKKTLRKYLEQILSGYFPVAPVNDRVCSFCPYRAICRKE